MAAGQFEKTVVLSEDVVFADKVYYEEESFAIVLTTQTLRLIHFGNGTEFVVHLCNVYGVDKVTKGNAKYVDVHTFVPKNRKKNRGDPFRGVDPNKGFQSRFRLRVLQEEDQSIVVDQIRAAIAGISIEELNSRKRRKFLIVINPFGGTKMATKIYKKQVWPMLTVADVDVETLYTTHAGHAFEIGQQLQLKQYDAVATVSGDGLLHEVLNGLLDRPDWKEAVKIPLAIIPGGSGNALAKTIDCEDPIAATFNLLKGTVRSMDIMAMQQNGKVIYSHLSLTHALIADIDVGSDDYRFFGTARFTMAALAQLLTLPKYPLKLAYLLHDAQEEEFSNNAAERPITSIADLRRFHNLTFDTIPPNWVKRETSLMMLTVSNSPWLSTDYLTVPIADFSDGHVDAILIENTTSSEIIPYFLELEKGTLAGAPMTEYLKIKALYFEPTRGMVAIDGELAKVAPLLLEVLPGLVRILVPEDLKMPPWKSLKPPSSVQPTQTQASNSSTK